MDGPCAVSFSFVSHVLSGKRKEGGKENGRTEGNESKMESTRRKQRMAVNCRLVYQILNWAFSSFLLQKPNSIIKSHIMLAKLKCSENNFPGS